MDAHAAELTDKLKELSLICRKLLKPRQEEEQRVDIVAQRGLPWLLDTSLDIIPIQVQLVFLGLEDLEHGAGYDSDVDSTHELLAVLHHDLGEHLGVDELVDEPTCASNILIDVRLEVARHVWQAILLLGPLLDRIVELDGELEDGKLGVLDFLFTVESTKILRHMRRRCNLKCSLLFNLVVRKLRVEQMEILVAP